MQNEFPVGIPNTLKPNSPSVKYFNELIQKTAKCPKVGIYQINYVTNKNLLDGILPRREEGRLIWDLRDGYGIYNSVDIDNALANGYTVTIVEGYYWEKTQNVFGNYINYLNPLFNKGPGHHPVSVKSYNYSNSFYVSLYGKTTSSAWSSLLAVVDGIVWYSGLQNNSLYKTLHSNYSSAGNMYSSIYTEVPLSCHVHRIMFKEFLKGNYSSQTVSPPLENRPFNVYPQLHGGHKLQKADQYYLCYD
ncbi:hypothetical protein MIR68_003115 [Amoeboaphelidium protococcarum]|nr:hypothetical protein MIR68_003115 [Amoeboaphelidium protococcarum]